MCDLHACKHIKSASPYYSNIIYRPHHCSRKCPALFMLIAIPYYTRCKSFQKLINICGTWKKKDEKHLSMKSWSCTIINIFWLLFVTTGTVLQSYLISPPANHSRCLPSKAGAGVRVVERVVQRGDGDVLATQRVNNQLLQVKVPDLVRKQAELELEGPIEC